MEPAMSQIEYRKRAKTATPQPKKIPRKRRKTAAITKPVKQAVRKPARHVAKVAVSRPQPNRVPPPAQPMPRSNIRPDGKKTLAELLGLKKPDAPAVKPPPVPAPAVMPKAVVPPPAPTAPLTSAAFKAQMEAAGIDTTGNRPVPTVSRDEAEITKNAGGSLPGAAQAKKPEATTIPQVPTQQTAADVLFGKPVDATPRQNANAPKTPPTSGPRQQKDIAER